MPFGGYHPYPRRFGGGKPALQIVHESLNAQRGSALNASDESTIVWLENMAYARAIVFVGWGTNQRLAHQWDPYRVTDMLSRWERIFRIIPPYGASDADRRAELVRRWQRFGAIANHAKYASALAATVGPFFVAVEYIPLAHAVVHSPDASYPWGTQVAGVPWYSTVAHILVRLQKPAEYTEGQFYEAAGKVSRILDPIAPAWVTFDWYRAGPSSSSVAGGPSAVDFYLDDEHNLDNEIFGLTPAPTVTSITPNTGTAAGGTSVTIAGTHLLFASGVTFTGMSGSAAATSIIATSDTSITCVTPAYGVAEVTDVVVTTPSGAGTGVGLYTFT